MHVKFKEQLVLPAILFIFVVASTISSCGGGGSGGSDVTPEVQTAMEDAADFEKTFDLISGSGSLEYLRAKMTSSFPEVTDLINGGSSARTAMLERFSGTASYADDTELAIYAYALEQMGGTTAVSTLKSFLESNLTTNFYLTPQMVANALRVLSSQSLTTSTYYFNLSEIEEILSTASADISPKSSFVKASPDVSCVRQYVLVDGSGNVITYAGPTGASVAATVSCNEFTSGELPPNVDKSFYTQKVRDGNGTYVTTDPEFVGEPSKQFNCAGYAFRILNGGSRWACDAGQMYNILVNKTSLLTEVSASSAQVGDKVFYFSGSTPGHVAEVQTVVPGVLSNTITVRNADNQSGLFDADVGASYYSSYSSKKYYRWANGSAPAVIADPRVNTNSAYCGATGTSGFTATISIPGYSISYSPTIVNGSNQGAYSGSVTLNDIVGIETQDGTNSSAQVATLSFDRRQISGTGSYSLNEMDKVFDSYNGDANLLFASPSIANANDGSAVVFSSTSGSVTLTAWSTSTGGALTGTYLANVSGTRITNAAGDRSETLTGTISGTFDVLILQ